MAYRRPKNHIQLLLRRVLLGSAVLILIATITVLLLNIFVIKPQSSSLTSVIKHDASKKTVQIIGFPIHLKIPTINVEAAITYVGVKPDGTMDVKSDPDSVYWYEFGPRPGEKGNAVIAGHYGWIGDKGSVFNNLNKLNKGDKILIIDENGIVITFIVSGSRDYTPEADASAVFKSSDGKSHLNLITCEGVWDNVKKTRSSRLVVFTDKK